MHFILKKFVPRDRGRQGRLLLIKKIFPTEEKAKKYKLKKLVENPVTKGGIRGDNGGESIISALKKWADTG